nr:unnamed protein product [Callosobruchus chinensis]
MEMRWLSEGNMSKLDELVEVVQAFLTEKNKELLHQSCETKLEICFAHLVDFFAQLNKVNLHLQVRGNLRLQDISR